LNCMGEIDPREAAYFLLKPNARSEQRRMGYAEGFDEPAPAVVSLDAALAAAATTELVLWMTGVRRPSPFTELDLLGVGRGKTSQWLTPRQVARLASCVQCSIAGLGDAAQLERYAWTG